MTKMAVAFKDQITMTEGFTAAMTTCWCGDVFQASGTSESVREKQAEWSAVHGDCKETTREEPKIFWLSFCDGSLPEGSQFLGACIVEVTAEEADEAAINVMRLFPLAQPGAEWIAAASLKAHRLGCNPGGEMASMEINADNPNLARYTFGVLMDRATCEALDKESA